MWRHDFLSLFSFSTLLILNDFSGKEIGNSRQVLGGSEAYEALEVDSLEGYDCEPSDDAYFLGKRLKVPKR